MANEYNIPELSAGQIVDLYTDIYYNAWLNGTLAQRPSLILWGEPGVGKTQSVEQLAGALSVRTGYQIEVTTVHLLLRNPTDLMGLPVVSKDRSRVHWVRPEEFVSLADDELPVLCLDDMSNAPPMMQAAAYEITLDRSIGGFRLPDNLIIIATGNHTREGLLTPLANRMQHIEVVADFTSWYTWALHSGIDERVIAYLSFDHSKLYVKPEKRSALAFPTPRSWEFVSRDLKLMPDREPSQLHSLISGCIGVSHAVEFEAFCAVWRDLPAADEILSGKTTCLKSKKADVLYAISSSLLSCASERGDTLSLTELDNMCEFALQFPPDFSAFFFRGLVELLGRIKLMNVPSFMRYLSRSGHISLM